MLARFRYLNSRSTLSLPPSPFLAPSTTGGQIYLELKQCVSSFRKTYRVLPPSPKRESLAPFQRLADPENERKTLGPVILFCSRGKERTLDLGRGRIRFVLLFSATIAPLRKRVRTYEARARSHTQRGQLYNALARNFHPYSYLSLFGFRFNSGNTPRYLAVSSLLLSAKPAILFLSLSIDSIITIISVSAIVQFHPFEQCNPRESVL